MMKLKKSSIVLAAALALIAATTTRTFADDKTANGDDSANVSQNAQNADDNSAIEETPGELSIYRDSNGNLVNQVADLEQQLTHDGGKEFIRIQHMNPADNKDKTVIIVHEGLSNEYLEVFTQTGDTQSPENLQPVKIFKDPATGEMVNTAAVSTAGVFNGRRYVTPTGDFAFDYFQTMHYSKAYNDAPMPFAMFFNSGIAIHGITPSEFKMLGRPASHGCVRTNTPNAEALFKYITPEKKANAVVEVLPVAAPAPAEKQS